MTRMSCRATVSCRWTVCCGRGWSALFPEAPQSRPAIPPASPVECYFMLWHEQASPLQAHLHGALLIGVWQACIGDIRCRLQQRRQARRCSWSISTFAKFQSVLKQTFTRKNHVLAFAWLLWLASLAGLLYLQKSTQSHLLVSHSIVVVWTCLSKEF